MQQKTSQNFRTGLSEKVINLIKPNTHIKNEIAKACHTSEWAVRNWINKNHPKLTQVDSLRIIRQETGLTDEQILSQIPA